LPQQLSNRRRMLYLAGLTIDDDGHVGGFVHYCPGKLRAFHWPTSRIGAA
jgi:hypothetical protein